MGSVVARIGSRSLYRSPPMPCARPALGVRSEHEFMAPSTVRATAASPSTPIPRRPPPVPPGPAAAEAHEVDARDRQGDRRRHIVADGPGPAALDGEGEGARVVPGPATSKRTAVPSAQPACLPTTKPMAPCTRSSDSAEARLPLPPGPVEGTAHVLLVHPAVEDPHLHELRVGPLADRAPADRRPLSSVSSSSWARRCRGDLDELGPHLGAGQGAAHGDPGLVAAGEIVLHVVAQGPVPLRRRLAHDGALDADQVRELVLDVPARGTPWAAPTPCPTARSRPRPARPRFLPGRRVAGAPPDLQPTLLTCAVVRHGPTLPPTRAGQSRDHPPISVTLPLRSTPVQGHHRREESPWLKYEGYCVKCREKREFDGQEVELANGRRAAQGTCPECGTKMNRILGKAKAAT